MKSLNTFIKESSNFPKYFNLAIESDIAAAKAFLNTNNFDIDIDEATHTITTKEVFIYENNYTKSGCILSKCDNRGKCISIIPTDEWIIKPQSIAFSTFGRLVKLDTSNIKLGVSYLKRVMVSSNIGTDALKCLKDIEIGTLFTNVQNVAPNVDADEIIYDWGGYNEIPFVKDGNINAKRIAIRGMKHYPFWVGFGNVYLKTQLDNNNCKDKQNMLVDFINANSGADIIACASSVNGTFAQLGVENGKLTFTQLNTNNLNKAFQNCK